MTKVEKKKLTLVDLIKDKEKIQPKENVTKEILVERLGATVTIRRAEKSLVMDTIELGNDENFEGNSDDFFIFNIITEPDLKDPELQKAYGCVEPTDIISKIFEIGEVTGIAQEGMKLAGYNTTVRAIDDLKN